MKVAYFYTNSITADEKTISESLLGLGHDVDLLHVGTTKTITEDRGYDLLLGHHIESPFQVTKHQIPIKVLWGFDLTVDKGGYLNSDGKGNIRRAWVVHMSQVVDHLFLSDGEAVSLVGDKATRLVQGAHTTYYHPCQSSDIRILFAGDIREQRQSFIAPVASQFPLEVITGKGNRVYGTEFAKLIARTGIVIAPDVPIKPNYWSNRVYVVCGAGGFLLHPYIEELSHQYEDGKEIVYYYSREDLMDKIAYWLPREEERKQIGWEAYQRTLRDHTYTHRVKQLMAKVEELIGAKDGSQLHQVRG